MEGGYLKDKETDKRPTYIQPELNADGHTATRIRTLKYKEGGDTWEEVEEYEVQEAKPGFFSGSLPSFQILE